MAKKKLNSKEKTNDEKLNLIMRRVHGRSLNILGEECLKNFTSNTIMEVINEMKNVFYEMDKREVSGFINDYYFMELLNYTEEMFMLMYSGKVNISQEMEFYRKKVVELHKKYNIRFEMYIYVNKIGVLFENYKLYPSNKGSYYSLVAKAITDLMFVFYQYASTYVLKIKNKKMKEFVKKGDNIEIKYDNANLISPEILDSTYTAIMNRLPVGEKQMAAIESVNASLHKIYSNYMSKDIHPDFFEETKGFIGLNKIYELPIVHDKEKMISFDDLVNIPNGRKYAFSKAGVRFEFLNKEQNIDYIDMIETKDSISLNVYIINNGGFYITNKVYSGAEWMINASNKKLGRNDIKDVDTKLIRIPFYIKKEDLSNATTYEDMIRAVNSVGYSPVPDDDIAIHFMMSLIILILCCIYSAYYDLNIFKSSLRLYNKSTSNKLGYNRTSGFRVAHLKRLPVGSRASEEAKQNAKKEGFDVIPDGYTFVRASYATNSENEAKKIIKIK